MSLYLTTDELSTRIKYDPRYIRERMKDRIFKKDVHYVQPFGGRKILYIWNEIEKIMANKVTSSKENNPMDKIILRKVHDNG
jgi:hypothetical protein